MKKLISLLLLAVPVLSFAQNTVDERVEEILSRMTIEEKICQLNQMDGRRDIEKVKQEVREGPLSSIMTSFNDNDGIPSTGNRWLLTQLLREQWGFDGETWEELGTTSLENSAYAYDASYDFEVPDGSETISLRFTATSTPRIDNIKLTWQTK